MRSVVAIAACATALLAACTLGPDYRRPAIDTPGAYRFEPASVADTADTKWWEQYGDPVLDALIAEALANNRNLEVAVANVAQAASIVTQTRASALPQIGYSGSAQQVKIPDTGLVAIIPRFPNPQTTYEALLSVSWELDLFGRVRRLSEAALANMLASEDARNAVILSLVASVATDYIQLRGLDDQLAIATKTLGAYGESVRLFELQFKYGNVSKMNVAQAQSQYESAAAQIPVIESQIAQTEHALSLLLGRHPGPIARGRSVDELVLPPVPAGVPSSLLERRPDLMQSEQQLVAANAQIGAAKAALFPRISLTGAFGGESDNLASLLSTGGRIWSIGFGLALPIFTAGRLNAEVDATTARERQAVALYQKSIQTAFREVADALTNIEQAAASQSDLQTSVEAATNALRLATRRYEVGYAPYLDILDAQRSLNVAQLLLIRNRQALLAASVDLMKALWGGWTDPEPLATN